MSLNKTAYLITIGEPNTDGIMADEFEETLICRLIERLNNDDNYKGKYMLNIYCQMMVVILNKIIYFLIVI